MKMVNLKILVTLLFSLSGFLLLQAGETKVVTVSESGKQPRIAVGTDDMIHLVYGDQQAVFYRNSTDGGTTFSEPREVIRFQKMHLGWKSGPQIVSSGNYLAISAVGESNNLQVWHSPDAGKNWQGPVTVNENAGSLPEGFHSISAGSDGVLAAVWLAATANGLKIAGSLSDDGGKSWQKEKIIYASPDGNVCVCCHPSIAMSGNKSLAVMWRNDLAGNRDMYLASSGNAGASFGAATMLGSKNWQLGGCPVDGGDLLVDAAGKYAAVWRRENTIYLSTADLAEQKLGEGRHAVIAASPKGHIIAWQKDKQLMLLTPGAASASLVGEGAFADLGFLPESGKIVLAYQNGAGIAMQTLTF